LSDESSTYDELPYSDNAFQLAHPDRLAVIGALHGLSPAPVDRCTVLELGCGLGGNIIPMAGIMPHSRFVGIDLSGRQIELGRSVIDQLGLANIELRRQDVMDFSPDEGPFDYILCHGVYSWVPREVQDRILVICGQSLAPSGLAMISYNTYPGWHLSGAVRDIMRYGARGAGSPAEQVKHAMDFLSLIARNVFTPESPYGVVVRAAAETLAGECPTYIFHEYLEDCNFPLSCEEFAGRARAANLRYVDEACMEDMSGLLSDESRGALSAVEEDIIRCEQMLDFLRCRQFRRDVLCRAELSPSRWPRPEAMTGMLLVSQAEPASASPDVTSGAPEQFRGPARRSLSTGEPALKSALVALHRARPLPMEYSRLLAEVRSEVGDVDEQLFSRSMVACAMAALVDLHTHLPPIAAGPGDRPLASPLARRQAASGKVVVDLRHRSVKLDGISAAVLAMLDGNIDRVGVCDAITERISAGRLTIEALPDGGRKASRMEIDKIVGEVLDALANLRLLMRREKGGFT
jgi:SAM-dependent methyltransferase